MNIGDKVWYDLSLDSVYGEKILAVRDGFWGKKYLITFGYSGRWVSERKLTPMVKED